MTSGGSTISMSKSPLNSARSAGTAPGAVAAPLDPLPASCEPKAMSKPTTMHTMTPSAKTADLASRSRRGDRSARQYGQ